VKEDAMADKTLSNEQESVSAAPRAGQKNAGLQLVTVLHATVTETANRIAHSGPPLDMVTQLCAVVAHVDLDLAGHVARERLSFLFPAQSPAQAQQTP
jgi:hypothetical protein